MVTLTGRHVGSRQVLRVRAGGTEYLFKNGQFFQKTPEGLVWKETPLGGVTKTLPPDAVSIWYQDNEYFECGSVYFRKTPDGYKVVPVPFPTN